MIVITLVMVWSCPPGVLLKGQFALCCSSFIGVEEHACLFRYITLRKCCLGTHNHCWSYTSQTMRADFTTKVTNLSIPLKWLSCRGEGVLMEGTFLKKTTRVVQDTASKKVSRWETKSETVPTVCWWGLGNFVWKCERNDHTIVILKSMLFNNKPGCYLPWEKIKKKVVHVFTSTRLLWKQHILSV